MSHIVKNVVVVFVCLSHFPQFPQMGSHCLGYVCLSKERTLDLMVAASCSYGGG